MSCRLQLHDYAATGFVLPEEPIVNIFSSTCSRKACSALCAAESLSIFLRCFSLSSLKPIIKFVVGCVLEAKADWRQGEHKNWKVSPSLKCTSSVCSVLIKFSFAVKIFLCRKHAKIKQEMWSCKDMALFSWMLFNEASFCFLISRRYRFTSFWRHSLAMTAIWTKSLSTEMFFVRISRGFLEWLKQLAFFVTKKIIFMASTWVWTVFQNDWTSWKDTWWLREVSC